MGFFQLSLGSSFSRTYLVEQVVQDDDFYGDWFPSGNVSLDCITGKGYLGFKYTGSGEEDFDGTYELDEIVVNSN